MLPILLTGNDAECWEVPEMFLSRRHEGNSTPHAAWDGPFAPAPSMAPARFNPMLKTAGELVADQQPALAVATAPTATPVAA